MIVCSCRRVSDRSVCDVIARGAGDVESIGTACGAGGGCGGCVPALLELLAAHGVASDVRWGSRLAGQAA